MVGKRIINRWSDKFDIFLDSQFRLQRPVRAHLQQQLSTGEFGIIRSVPGIDFTGPCGFREHKHTLQYNLPECLCNLHSYTGKWRTEPVLSMESE